MNIRAQVSMVFHLDKCIGCHTCSIACKNLWTERRGTEYMWWNNVETKPGVGYPYLWEDQEKYRGGWKVHGGKLKLRMKGRAGTLANLFFNPYLPALDDYYEPWTYRYRDVSDAPEGDEQPVARPVSTLTGKPMEIGAGPNWDDDFGGSSLYAANDPGLKGLSEEERRQLFELESMAFFYLPRICNHCINPGCLAACPAGAIYKRGEDGIVLVSQEKCRAWRMCITGCPYKKTYYNWAAGKSEKCILCYPRQETGQAPACFHSCVGRIRYLGLLLYDADRIESAAAAEDSFLVHEQLSLLLDPFDREVIREAKAQGMHDATLECAQKSPVYRFVKEWKLALPLHPEYRTLPMLFYVPPLLPVLAHSEGGLHNEEEDFFSSLENTRIPVRYFASLLSAGEEEPVRQAYRKMTAVRLYKRAMTVGDVGKEKVKRALEEAGTNPEEIEAIYRLTALPSVEDRFVIPPFMREQAVEAVGDPLRHRNSVGTGFLRVPGIPEKKR
ncbi:MAG: nitrate reductase subunit beta [Nitrospirales bacterium]|nr:nitrate reductase subunit beta [Nitrospirales bacterium]